MLITVTFLISVGCHPLESVTADLFLPVRPRLSTVLCKFSHIYFAHDCHFLFHSGVTPGGSSPPPVTPLKIVAFLGWKNWVAGKTFILGIMFPETNNLRRSLLLPTDLDVLLRRRVATEDRRHEQRAWTAWVRISRLTNVCVPCFHCVKISPRMCSHERESS